MSEQQATIAALVRALEKRHTKGKGKKPLPAIPIGTRVTVDGNGLRGHVGTVVGRDGYGFDAVSVIFDEPAPRGFEDGCCAGVEQCEIVTPGLPSTAEHSSEEGGEGLSEAALLRRAAKDATEIERLRGVCEDWAAKYNGWRDACLSAEAEIDDLRGRLAAVERRLTREALCSPRNAALVADLRAALANPSAAQGEEEALELTRLRVRARAGSLATPTPEADQ